MKVTSLHLSSFCYTPTLFKVFSPESLTIFLRASSGSVLGFSRMERTNTVRSLDLRKISKYCGSFQDFLVCVGYDENRLFLGDDDHDDGDEM